MKGVYTVEILNRTTVSFLDGLTAYVYANEGNYGVADWRSLETGTKVNIDVTDMTDSVSKGYIVTVCSWTPYTVIASSKLAQIKVSKFLDDKRFLAALKDAPSYFQTLEIPLSEALVPCYEINTWRSSLRPNGISLYRYWTSKVDGTGYDRHCVLVNLRPSVSILY